MYLLLPKVENIISGFFFFFKQRKNPLEENKRLYKEILSIALCRTNIFLQGKPIDIYYHWEQE